MKNKNDAPYGYISIDVSHPLDCKGCAFGDCGFSCIRPDEYDCNEFFREDNRNVIFIRSISEITK